MSIFCIFDRYQSFILIEIVFTTTFHNCWSKLIIFMEIVIILIRIVLFRLIKLKSRSENDLNDYNVRSVFCHFYILSYVLGLFVQYFPTKTLLTLPHPRFPVKNRGGFSGNRVGKTALPTGASHFCHMFCEIIGRDQ